MPELRHLKEEINTQRIMVWAIVLFVVIADQISKYAVKNGMNLYESRKVLGNFFKLTYIENPGMAFGIQFENKILFTLLSIFAAVLVLIYLLRLPDERFLFKISLSLILGGAIGNLMDRILYGRVVDFFDVEFFDISIPSFSFLFVNFQGYSLTRWPVFNIADSAVTCGMILITWAILFQKDPEKLESIS
jgi:signal peptidase II